MHAPVALVTIHIRKAPVQTLTASTAVIRSLY